MKLGGWQRLWVVVSAIALIVVGVVSVLLFPNASVVEHAPNFYANLSSEAKAQLASDDDAEASKVEVSNGHVISVRKEINLTQSTPLLAEYESQIRQTLWTKRVRLVIIATATWLTFSVGTYGLGWSVGWIYRGFKPGEVQPPNKTLQPPSRTD